MKLPLICALLLFYTPTPGRTIQCHQCFYIEAGNTNNQGLLDGLFSGEGWVGYGDNCKHDKLWAEPTECPSGVSTCETVEATLKATIAGSDDEGAVVVRGCATPGSAGDGLQRCQTLTTEQLEDVFDPYVEALTTISVDYSQSIGRRSGCQDGGCNSAQLTAPGCGPIKCLGCFYVTAQTSAIQEQYDALFTSEGSSALGVYTTACVTGNTGQLQTVDCPVGVSSCLSTEVTLDATVDSTKDRAKLVSRYCGGPAESSADNMDICRAHTSQSIQDIYKAIIDDIAGITVDYALSSGLGRSCPVDGCNNIGLEPDNCQPLKCFTCFYAKAETPAIQNTYDTVLQNIEGLVGYGSGCEGLEGVQSLDCAGTDTACVAIQTTLDTTVGQAEVTMRLCATQDNVWYGLGSCNVIHEHRIQAIINSMVTLDEIEGIDLDFTDATGYLSGCEDNNCNTQVCKPRDCHDCFYTQAETTDTQNKYNAMFTNKPEIGMYDTRCQADDLSGLTSRACTPGATTCVTVEATLHATVDGTTDRARVVTRQCADPSSSVHGLETCEVLTSHQLGDIFNDVVTSQSGLTVDYQQSSGRRTGCQANGCNSQKTSPEDCTPLKCHQCFYVKAGESGANAQARYNSLMPTLVNPLVYDSRCETTTGLDARNCGMRATTCVTVQSTLSFTIDEMTDDAMVYRRECAEPSSPAHGLDRCETLTQGQLQSIFEPTITQSPELSVNYLPSRSSGYRSGCQDDNCNTEQLGPQQCQPLSCYSCSHVKGASQTAQNSLNGMFGSESGYTANCEAGNTDNLQAVTCDSRVTTCVTEEAHLQTTIGQGEGAVAETAVFITRGCADPGSPGHGLDRCVALTQQELQDLYQPRVNQHPTLNVDFDKSTGFRQGCNSASCNAQAIHQGACVCVGDNCPPTLGAGCARAIWWQALLGTAMVYCSIVYPEFYLL